MKISSPLYIALRRPVRRVSISGVVISFLIVGQLVKGQTPTPAASPTAVSSQQKLASLPLFADGEHRLNPGETQSFSIHLEAGQFFHALIEQKDIDVLVTYYGPDGNKVGECDSPNDRRGFESVLLVADTPGDYRIDVQSTNKGVPAGKYENKTVALREATAVDRGHVTAQQLFTEGQKLRNQTSATSKRASIDKYLAAIPLFQTAGDSYRQALSLLSVGIACAQLNEFRQAIPYLDETVALARTLGDRRLEASTETLLGGMRDFLGDMDQALSQYDHALELARETGNQVTEASSLNNIGKIYNDRADWQKALEYYGQALPLYQALGSPRAAITLNNIAVAYNALGDPTRAIEVFQRSIELLHAGTDRNAESYTLSNMGYAYKDLGDYQTALEYAAKARAIQQQTGNRGQEAETLDLIGMVYSSMGDPTKALGYHQQSLEIYRATGNLRREATSLSNIGHVYNLLHQPDKALVQLDAALSLYRSIGDLNGVAVALERIARAEQDLGKTAEALKRIQESLDLIEKVRGRSGSQQLRATYLASRKQAYDFYVDLLMQQHVKDPSEGFDGEALRVFERSRARSLLEMLAESAVDIRQGVDAALVKREHDLSQLLNAKAERQIQLLAQKGSPKELDIVKSEINALDNDYQQVQAVISKNSPQYAALTQPQPLTLQEIQSQLDSNTILLEYSLGEKRSFVWVVSPTSLNSYELPPRADLEKNARQVYDLLTARSISKPAETITQKRLRLAELDSQLATTINDLSRQVLAPVAGKLGTKRLFVVADGALQYVPFAALSAAYQSPLGVTGTNAVRKRAETSSTATHYRPLIFDHEIISLPSISALAVQRKSLAGRRAGTNAIAVIADPVFSTDDERLKPVVSPKESSTPPPTGSADIRSLEYLPGSPSNLVIRRLRFTRQEADQIVAVAPGSANLKALDFNADRAIATSAELGGYRYVHFATHGYLDSQRPDLSAIVLSLVDKNGKPQDGFLRAHDIYNLKLSADLVVLSACQTGLGKDIKGEGLVGLTRGFMYAGARRVVVSLWNVNDKATAELMQRFYRGMLREDLTPASALRKAQAELARDPQWHSPYYWAAFVLQGD